MKRLVFFLEEPSAKEMLLQLIPRILPQAEATYLSFQGKQDLEKNLEKKIKGWLVPSTVFVILRDQDSGDCIAIKNKLQNICLAAKTQNYLIRIACRELESYYLGDLNAVEKGLNITGLAKLQQKAKYRNPDKLECPSKELARLTGHKYTKITGSRNISPHLNLENNNSPSFRALVSGLIKITQA